MRCCLIVILALGVLAGHAAADKKAAALELTLEGNALARAKNYTAAIAKFKAGQRLHPTWESLCNIGLAYSLLNKLGAAELYLRRCKGLAGDEFPRAKKVTLADVERRLAAARFTLVSLSNTPPGATVSVKAYAADDAPRPGEVFWLAPGKHSIRVTKPGMAPRVIGLDLVGQPKLTRNAALERLRPPEQPKVAPPQNAKPSPPIVAPVAKNPPVGPQPHRDESTRARVGWVPRIAVIGGLLGVATGAVFHVYALRTHDRATSLPALPAGQPHPAYDSELSTFQSQRAAAVGFYAVGALATGVGTYLWLRARRTKSKRVPAVSLVPTLRGAAVFARWSL